MFLPADLEATLEMRQRHFEKGTGPQKARDAANMYVRERHPHSSCAVLVGSYARGEATFWSDVDIFILDEGVGAPFLTQTIVDSFPIQASAFNIATAWSLLERDYRSGSFYLVAAFAYAGYLSGSGDLHASLAARALSLLQEGPPPQSQMAVASSRAAIVNQLIKLSRTSGCPVQFGTCSKLLESFGRYLQLDGRSWLSGDAPFDEYLQRSPEYQKAVAAVPGALEGNALPLVEAIAEALSARGHIVWSTDDLGPLPIGA